MLGKSSHWSSFPALPTCNFSFFFLTSSTLAMVVVEEEEVWYISKFLWAEFAATDFLMIWEVILFWAATEMPLWNLGNCWVVVFSSPLDVWMWDASLTCSLAWLDLIWFWADSISWIWGRSTSASRIPARTLNLFPSSGAAIGCEILLLDNLVDHTKWTFSF